MKSVTRKLLTPTIMICLGSIALATLVASINPPYPHAYQLHLASTVLFVIGLLAVAKFFPLHRRSWIWATVFTLLHVLGARYIYSFVPYNEWINAWFGIDLHSLFGWQRNMYDRLVHFAFGLCLFPLMFDVAKSIFKPLPVKQLIVIVLLANMSMSMLYELFEWLIAVMMSPENAESYNGQQGDMWDAHKDMGLALVGGMIGAFFIPISWLNTPTFETKV